MPIRLAAAFTLSGVAGLAYELVWTRYLALLVGHAAYAQVLVLAVYLGGTAVGSILVADRSRSIRRPLRAYAWAEAGLGVLGMAFHALFLAGQWLLYRALAPAGALSAGSWTVAVLLILPQAVLLGTTFPLMSAGLVRRFPAAPGRSVADVYRLNTLGGALGVLLAGFVAVPTAGLPLSAVAAGALNLLAAALAFGGDVAVDERGTTEAGGGRAPATRRLPALLLAGTFGSALASFLYEIGWVRMLSLLLGSATHAFELMLSAFLLGLGIGSLLARRWADRAPRPVPFLGGVQWWMGFAALLTLPIYAAGFPAMAWLVTHLPRTDQGYALFNAARYAIAIVVMLPATAFAGMTLPLFTAALLRQGEGERVIGLANGANTIGSLIGAVVGGLVLLPLLGLKGTLLLGAGLDMAVGVVLLAAAGGTARPPRIAWISGAAAAALLAGVGLVLHLDRALLTSGVYRTGYLPAGARPEIPFYRDGATATVAVTRTASGFTTISTNGKPDASLGLRWLQRAAGVPVPPAPISGEDESTQVYSPLILLAHNPGARRAAVVGHGSGMSAQILLGSPRLDSLLDIEIEPAMILGSMQFLPANRRAFTDPRSRFVLEDARTTLAGAGAPFDLIFSEPSNPWVSGVASLFTEQFYRRVRARLSEHGVFGQWFHLYEMEDGLLLSVLASIDRSFPDWTAWMVGNADILIVAGNGTLPAPDWTVLDHADVRADLSIAPLPRPAQLENLRLFGAASFHPLLAGLPGNSDYRPVLDTRAERARFRRTVARGLFSFATDWVDLPILLAGPVRGPLPFDPLPVSGVAPLDRRAIAGWLQLPAEARIPPPDAGWRRALEADSAFLAGLRDPDAAPGWSAWTHAFAEIESGRHARTSGWVDEPFYAAIDSFLEARAAPPDVRASVALLRGVRGRDFTTAAAAAERLVASPDTTLLPRALLRYASVAAFLGAKRPEDARRAFRATTPVGEPRDLRTIWLSALVGEPADVRSLR